jgi:hypothetical protein
MSEQSKKTLIKEIQQMFDPAVEEDSKIANLLEYITDFPATPMTAMQPTKTAQEQPAPTPENIGASMNTPLTDKLFMRKSKGV